MIILKEDEINPDLLHSINKLNNIIICTPAIDKCIIESPMPDILSIILTQGINLSMSTNILANIMPIEYKPRIKILMPAGLRMNIVEPSFGETTNIFNKIYCNYDTFFGYSDMEKTMFDYTIFENFEFVSYVDIIQMRKKTGALYLNKGETIADIFFTWYTQCKVQTPSIENIYLIKDTYLFQEFTRTI